MSLDYGIVGNCRTAALVKNDSAVSWMCIPRFDSPSIFAKLLDPKGGECTIIPKGKHKYRQEYIPKTAVLRTRFTGKGWSFSVYDFFPRYREESGEHNHLIRLIKKEKGKPSIKIVYKPRPDYARAKTRLVEKEGVPVTQPNESVYLRASIPYKKLNKGYFALKDNCYLIISEKPVPQLSLKIVEKSMQKTVAYWENFVKQATIPKRHAKSVTRSAITLKLLQYAPTGAFVAAATTSLPEIVGDVRNWDYRYCWLRDAAFAIDAFTRICRFEEAADFMDFLITLCGECMPIGSKISRLQIMYGIGGETQLTEHSLDHLKGYKNSRPVRIGNAAYKQHQIDVAGEVLDAIYHFYVHYSYTPKLPKNIWNMVLLLARHIEKEWKNKDHGLWEFRDTKEHFTHSKLLCWVGINSAIKIAESYKKKAPLPKWKKLRENIQSDILAKAWNSKKKAFTMFYGSKDLDASLLLMPILGFIDARHPKMLSTIKAIEKELRAGCCFVFRYKRKDDFGKPKNTFSICSFWLVQALYLAGKKSKAQKVFKHLLLHGNHLGLFSEGINPKNGALTGNFPQAYTHIALINTAVQLAGRGVQRPVCMIKPNDR